MIKLAASNRGKVRSVCKRGWCNFDSRQEPRARSTPETEGETACQEEEHQSEAKEQRCWNHRLLNILDKLPLTPHGRRAESAHEDPLRATRTAVIWKTLLIAEKTFLHLDASELLADVARGEVYVNGVRAVNRREVTAAA